MGEEEGDEVERGLLSAVDVLEGHHTAHWCASQSSGWWILGVFRWFQPRFEGPAP